MATKWEQLREVVPNFTNRVDAVRGQLTQEQKRVLAAVVANTTFRTIPVDKAKKGKAFTYASCPSTLVGKTLGLPSFPSLAGLTDLERKTKRESPEYKAIGKVHNAAFRCVADFLYSDGGRIKFAPKAEAATIAADADPFSL